MQVETSSALCCYDANIVLWEKYVTTLLLNLKIQIRKLLLIHPLWLILQSSQHWLLRHPETSRASYMSFAKCSTEIAYSLIILIRWQFPEWHCWIPWLVRSLLLPSVTAIAIWWNFFFPLKTFMFHFMFVLLIWSQLCHYWQTFMWLFPSDFQAKHSVKEIGINILCYKKKCGRDLIIKTKLLSQTSSALQILKEVSLIKVKLYFMFIFSFFFFSMCACLFFLTGVFLFLCTCQEKKFVRWFI